MPTRQQQLLDFLHDHPGSPRSAIRGALRVTDANLARIIGDAMACRLVRAEGQRGHYRYWLAVQGLQRVGVAPPKVTASVFALGAHP